MTNKREGDDEIQTFKVTFIKSDSNYTPEEMSKIVDTLGRAVLKDIWKSLRTEEDIRGAVRRHQANKIG
ncbi:hypothetical protein ABLU27_00350 (plasmid) [Lactococcus lactis]|uniref:hypothetical protein n=1 Tax=Lactococcus lactis TaxID=1358 RepID=UPI0033144C06